MNVGDFADLPRGDAIFLSLDAADKPALLAALALRAAPIAGLPAALILARVHDREALGATGFGRGVAIPHARIPGLAEVTVVIARLAVPVDYGALDSEPVDLAVMLLSPQGVSKGTDHLKALARISRAMRNPAILAAMREVPTTDALFAAINHVAPSVFRAA